MEKKQSCFIQNSNFQTKVTRGLEIQLEEFYKTLYLDSCCTQPKIEIYVLENPSLKEIQSVLENSVAVKPTSTRLIFSICSKTNKEAQNRLNKRSAEFLAQKSGCFYIEAPQNFNSDLCFFKAIISNVFEIYQLHGTPLFERMLKRYYYCLQNITHIQALFSRNLLIKKIDDPNLLDLCGFFKSFKVSLIDSLMDQEKFNLMVEATVDQMQLWQSISKDYSWQIEKLEVSDFGKSEFVKNLIKISKEKNKNHAGKTKGRLFLARNDFIVHKKDKLPKQIEINLIAVSIGLQSDGVRNAHQVLNNLTGEVQRSPKALKCIQNFANAVSLAHSFYPNKGSVFVIVVDGNTANILDMEAMVQPLSEKGIVTRFYTFEDIYQLGNLNKETGSFTIMDEEVAVFYLRTGYNPDQYTPQSWECRREMELSNAIVCPDIDAQITNLKYMQYYLSKQETWARYGLDELKFKKSSQATVKILLFDIDFKSSKKEMISYIEANGGYESFVLKPCKEGGGNNYFDSDIKRVIENFSESELSDFILMDKIVASEEIGMFTDFESIMVGPIINEIGIYSSAVWNPEGEVVHQKTGDYFIKSRSTLNKEGPVIAGIGFTNSLSII